MRQVAGAIQLLQKRNVTYVPTVDVWGQQININQWSMCIHNINCVVWAVYFACVLRITVKGRQGAALYYVFNLLY